MVTQVKFSIDGRFSDVHPYMDYLLLLTQDYELCVVDWVAWIQRVMEDIPNERAFVHATLLENRGLAKLSGKSRPAGLRNLGTVPEDLIKYRAQLGITSCSDWVVYNRTLYYATSNGVWMMPLLINGDFDGVMSPQEIVDSRAFHLRARFGLVAMACGANGLAARGTYAWDFQRLPEIDLRVIHDLPTDRIGWMHENIVSIRPNAASLLYNSLVKADYGGLMYQTQGERRAIGDFSYRRRPPDELFADHLLFERAFTSNSRLYAWSGSNVKVAAFEDASPLNQLEVVEEFELPVETIFEGSSFERGLVFDTDRGTYFVNAVSLKPQLISPKENVVVRTFTQSRKYPRQVWSVKEDRIDITAV